MLRARSLRTYSLLVLVLPLLFPATAHGDPYDDLMRAYSAFSNTTSWHADELFSNGKTVTLDHAAPDRWRIQPNPNMTEVIIGNDVYMIRNGHATKLPFGGGMIRKMIEGAAFSVRDEVRQTARDLGMQALDGRPVHAYSYSSSGNNLVTLYLDANWLPVQTVVEDKNQTTTIKYSKYNEPVSIEAD